MKKLTKEIIFVFVLVLIFAIIGLYFFSIFGAKKCDFYYVGEGIDRTMIGSCNCFCCDLFNTRGYESCGIFGLLTGAFTGIIFSLIIIVLWNRFCYKK